MKKKMIPARAPHLDLRPFLCRRQRRFARALLAPRSTWRCAGGGARACGSDAPGGSQAAAARQPARQPVTTARDEQRRKREKEEKK